MNEDLAVFVIDHACRSDASYADVRVENRYEETFTISNGKVENVIQRRKSGLGIRVLVQGIWGFCSTTDLTRTNIRKSVSTAVKAAETSAKHATSAVRLAETKAYRDSYKIERKVDIEDYAIEDKISKMQEWERDLHVSKNVSLGLLDYYGYKIDKLFMNNEGACIKSSNMNLVAELRAEATQGGNKQFYDIVVGGSGGFEVFDEKDMGNIAEETGKKACKLLVAKRTKPERNVNVIMAPTFLSLVNHEICGHASEGDRVLGEQSAWAGRSWWARQVGKKIGSEQMTLYDDPTLARTHSYYLYDDEGVKARRKILVEKGVLKEYLQSRASAAALDAEPNSGMRALSYEYVPLIRMSNTLFGSGDWTPEEMIRDVKHGYLLIGSYGRESSVDDKRYSIAISPHEAYEIENGELSTYIRDMTIASVSQAFFQSIDAASKDEVVDIHLACGKGDPMQIIPTGNGGPYIRGVVNVV